MLRRILLILTASIFILVSVACATPTEEVKKTVDEVVRIVADKEM
ncbi:MAG: ABC transporter substrate-binding protein, partial [Geobacteraceae bacterium]|nr:ABC transporter substrate-binding protein [Geobacteraceae bacterium]